MYWAKLPSDWTQTGEINPWWQSSRSSTSGQSPSNLSPSVPSASLKLHSTLGLLFEHQPNQSHAFALACSLQQNVPLAPICSPEWVIRCNSPSSLFSIACNIRAICPGPLHPIVATAPMDLLHVDFTTIEMTLELNQPHKVTNILVFQDHFMKYVMVYVTPNQTAKTVAKFLYQGYISIFGVLARLLSNWGANFMSSIIDKMCKVLGMKKLWTTPHHQQTNGLVERLHQTTMQIIGKLGEDKKANWPGQCRGPHERHLCQMCGQICGYCLWLIEGHPLGSSGPVNSRSPKTEMVLWPKDRHCGSEAWQSGLIEGWCL